MTPEQRLRQVTSKVVRAEAHFETLTREIHAFRDTNPFQISTRNDPASGQTIYFASRAEPCPEAIALTTGDVMQCLVTALDHLAYQLVAREVGDPPPNANKIYFPVAKDAQSFPDDRDRKMRGAHPDTFIILDGLEPYKGGDDVLWRLHKLNNIDKHRTLLAAGSAMHSFDFGSAVEKMIQRDVAKLPEDSQLRKAGVKVPPLFLATAGHEFPLEPGKELLRLGPEMGAPRVNFEMGVALHEPEALDAPVPVTEMLFEMIARVKAVALALAPRLQ